MRQLSLWVLMIGLLSACGSSPVRVPNPLPQMKSEFALKQLWRADTGVGAEQRHLKLLPVYAQNILYVADSQGRLLALDADNGRQLWKRSLGYNITAGIGIGAGQLYLASDDGDVLAVRAEDGEPVWHSKVSSEVLAPPVYAENSLLVHTIDGKLFALDSSNGRIRWGYDRSVPVLTLRGTSTPVVKQGTVFETFGSGKLAILQLSDGKLLFERPLGFASGRSDLDRIHDADAGLLLDRDVAYTATYQGSILALNLRSGAQLWSRKASIYQPMLIEGEILYAVDSDDTIWAFNKRNGVPVWKQDALFARQLSAPVLSGDYLLFADYQGVVHVLDKRDGHFVSRYQGQINEHRYRKTEGGLQVLHPVEKLGVLATPLVVGDKVYTYSRHGRLTALQLPRARQ